MFSLRASSCVFKAKNIRYEENCTSKFEFAKFKLNARRLKKIKENLNLHKQKLMYVIVIAEILTIDEFSYLEKYSSGRTP